jgi:hypothetical protein
VGNPLHGHAGEKSGNHEDQDHQGPEAELEAAVHPVSMALARVGRKRVEKAARIHDDSGGIRRRGTPPNEPTEQWLTTSQALPRSQSTLAFCVANARVVA